MQLLPKHDAATLIYPLYNNGPGPEIPSDEWRAYVLSGKHYSVFKPLYIFTIVSY